MHQRMRRLAGGPSRNVVLVAVGTFGLVALTTVFLVLSRLPSFGSSSSFTDAPFRVGTTLSRASSSPLSRSSPSSSSPSTRHSTFSAPSPSSLPSTSSTPAPSVSSTPAPSSSPSSSVAAPSPAARSSSSSSHPYGRRPPPSLAWAPRVAAECEEGKVVTAGPWAQDCIPDQRVLKETQLRFPPFVLPMPRFVAAQDREWFVSQRVVEEFIEASLQCFQRPLPAGMLCPLLDSHVSSDDVLVFWTDKYVTGKNLVLADGAFGQYQGCSWSTAYDTYLKEYPAFFGKTPRQWNKLAPMIVVQGWSFQHLIDGVLPRLMQAWEGLQADPNITILVDYNLPKFPVVQKIWEYLLPVDRLVVFRPDTIFQGQLWYQSCQSPPFHPYLWKKMRELFGYQELPFEDRNTIVYLGRGKRSGQTYNGGRSVTNEDEFITGLEAFIAQRNREREAAGREKLELVVFNHNDFPTLESTIKFFNRAKALIGPHGGSFYNLLFTPSHTLTIEFMPQHDAPNFIIWQQAVMLDHTYYLLPYPARGGDIKVDVDAILDIFHREIPN